MANSTGRGTISRRKTRNGTGTRGATNPPPGPPRTATPEELAYAKLAEGIIAVLSLESTPVVVHDILSGCALDLWQESRLCQTDHAGKVRHRLAQLAERQAAAWRQQLARRRRAASQQLSTGGSQ